MNYVLGLDVGIASVGYAICSVDENEQVTGLIDLGVRTFDKAETDKKSLNAKRRECRGKRRLIRRRRLRLIKLKSFLFEKGIIDNFDKDNNIIKDLPNNPWKLRVKALDRKLTNIEFATILIHLLKHRGYKSLRKSESKNAKDEKGKVLSAIKINKEKLKDGTCAQIAINEFQKENNHIRNKSGQYNHSFGRDDLLNEFHEIYKKQQEFNNPIATEELKEKFIEIFEDQKEPLQGDALLKMVGKCTLEAQEFRAAKNTYSVERHVWLTKLNNLRILQDGEERELIDEERAKLINLPYEKSELTFKKVREELKVNEKVVFKVSGKSEDKNTFMKLKAFHKIKKVVKDKDQWEIIKSSPALMDAIGTAFSIYKIDNEIQKALEGQNKKFINLLNKVHPDIENELKKLNENTITQLILKINFDKFSNLSLLALSKILPIMEQGKRYDEAVEKIYHNTIKNIKENEKYLPVIKTQEINNPVVIRSLSQTRKLINAVINKYGSPVKINIELARDVGKSRKVRNEIDTQNKNNKTNNDSLKKEFKELFGKEPTNKEFIKYKLYKEQNCKCVYSGEKININRLLEEGYVEIDHALPYSRTLDDSLNNKVLVLAGENQNKGNKTPYEYFQGSINSNKWQKFKALVDNTDFHNYKKQYLLSQKIDEEAFKEKNLNDTKYIARFLKNFIENNLLLLSKNKKKVRCTNGRITSFLRNRWGLNKDREQSDRHHALDACVIACVNDSIIQKVVKYYQQKENNRYISQKDNFPKDNFPKPWEFFNQEVNIRVFSDDPKKDLKEEAPDRFNKIEQQYLRALFVSRAPRRKISGPLHKETLRSAKYYLSERISTNRFSINELTLANIEKLHDKERNKKLYELLKTRLENKDTSPLYISEKDKLANNKLADRPVKKVTLADTQKSGFSECEKFKKIKAIADNATMVRADIFENKGEYYAVPIYLWQINLPQAPNISTNSKDVSGFNFKFSLYKNDLVKIKTKKSGEFFLYYVCLDSSNSGTLFLKSHDFDNNKFKQENSIKDKNENIRLKFHKNFEIFEKWTVDILGNKFKVKSEQRRWFELRNSKDKNKTLKIKEDKLEKIE